MLGGSRRPGPPVPAAHRELPFGKRSAGYSLLRPGGDLQVEPGPRVLRPGKRPPGLESAQRAEVRNHAGMRRAGCAKSTGTRLSLVGGIGKNRTAGRGPRAAALRTGFQINSGHVVDSMEYPSRSTFVLVGFDGLFLS